MVWWMLCLITVWNTWHLLLGRLSTAIRTAYFTRYRLPERHAQLSCFSVWAVHIHQYHTASCGVILRYSSQRVASGRQNYKHIFCKQMFVLMHLWFYVAQSHNERAVCVLFGPTILEERPIIPPHSTSQSTLLPPVSYKICFSLVHNMRNLGHINFQLKRKDLFALLS
jgi:hypothetical protein